MVTSGSTRAYIDRIRYIANTSSGALGARIVETLIEADIPVIHIYGEGSRQPTVHNSHLLESVKVTTVDHVITSVKSACKGGNISAVVHAMAVLDYVPETSIETKKTSDEEFWDVRLVRTPKIISIIRDIIPDVFTIGFKLEAGVEHDELLKRAGVLLQKYGLDVVVANDLEKVSDERHEAVFIGTGNKIIGCAETKEDIARKITDFIIKHM